MTLNQPEIENESLLSPCGLYCGVCGVYVATRDSNEDLRLKMSKMFGTRAVKTACKGCMQPEPPECLFSLCKLCTIRTCVKDKDFESCAQCTTFPCDKITNFPIPIAREYMLEGVPFWKAQQQKLGEKAGNRAFAKAQLERFTCKKCGKSLFRGATWCKNCNSPVTPAKLEAK